MAKKPKPIQLKKAVFVIDDPVVKGSLLVFVNHDFAYFKKFIEKNMGEDGDPVSESGKHSAGYYVSRPAKSGAMTFNIWLGHFDYGFRDICVLTHELTHYVFGLFEKQGIPIRAENDEIFAYVLEYYQISILRKLNKRM